MDTRRSLCGYSIVLDGVHCSLAEGDLKLNINIYHSPTKADLMLRASVETCKVHVPHHLT